LGSRFEVRDTRCKARGARLEVQSSRFGFEVRDSKFGVRGSRKIEKGAAMNMTNSAYARHRGVSETAVRKAITSGRITLEADGRIDPQNADAQWRRNSDPSKQRQQTPLGKMKKVPKAAWDAPNDTTNEFGLPPQDDDYMRAKTAHEVLKAEIGKIELRVLKGELVDRQKALALVFKAARTERDAWLNWPSRVSAQWAAQLGVEENLLYQELYQAVRNQVCTLAGKSPQ
jgi:hypothetical protein